MPLPQTSHVHRFKKKKKRKRKTVPRKIFLGTRPLFSIYLKYRAYYILRIPKDLFQLYFEGEASSVSTLVWK